MPEEPIKEKDRSNWVLPEIPEDKLRDEAIKFVAEKIGISELWVMRIHDFQWQTVEDCVVNNKTVLVPQMFRFLMRDSALVGGIEKLTDDIRLLQTQLERQKTIKHSTVKGTAQEKIKQIKDEIKFKEKQIKEQYKLLQTKTRKAYAARHHRTDTGTK